MKYDKVDSVSFMDVILETFLTYDSTDYSFPPLGLLHGGSILGLSVLLLTERMDLQIPGSAHLPIRIFNSLVELGRKQKTGNVTAKSKRAGYANLRGILIRPKMRNCLNA